MTRPNAPFERPELQRLSLKDFHPEVLRLFDHYVHGLIDRRGFLDGAGKLAVGTTAAKAAQR